MKKLLKVLLITFFIFGAFSSKSYAATNLSLSPASGTVSGTFAVQVNIDTGTDAINGIEVNIAYTGPIQYVSGTAGNVTGCTPTITSGTNLLTTYCFIDPSTSFTGTGRYATLTFSATGAGTATFTPTIESIAGSSNGTITGATYTVSVATTTPTPTGGIGGSLPYTGARDTVALIFFVIIGIGLLVEGITGFSKFFPQRRIVRTVGKFS